MASISYAASFALSTAMLTALTLPATAATEKVLYSFKSAQYGGPQGRLLLRGASLLGTGSGIGAGGDGQVFRLVQSKGIWKEASPLQFDGTDGSEPNAGLIANSLGTFYGTTVLDDAYGGGNVFALWKSGSVWLHGTVWAFGNGSDGKAPYCDLIMDSSGNLYGTTAAGGSSDYGIVFELSYNGSYWTEYVLHNFTDSDGALPDGGLMIDRTGALYGTTSGGSNPGCLYDYGCGTVFELSPNGGGWTFSTLYNFAGGTDGGSPSAGLIEGSKGALYGTAYVGGGSGCGGGGCGTVFELTESGGVWSEKVLYSFTGGSDGSSPGAALHWNSSGGLYGTTNYGGAYGWGAVFELTQSGGVWTENVLHSFGNGNDGQGAGGAVILDKSGNLYGTTWGGGSYSYGTVWEVTP